MLIRPVGLEIRRPHCLRRSVARDPLPHPTFQIGETVEWTPATAEEGLRYREGATNASFTCATRSNGKLLVAGEKTSIERTNTCR